jgi:hypothetical protein
MQPPEIGPTLFVSDHLDPPKEVPHIRRHTLEGTCQEGIPPPTQLRLGPNL